MNKTYQLGAALEQVGLRGSVTADEGVVIFKLEHGWTLLSKSGEVYGQGAGAVATVKIKSNRKTVKAVSIHHTVLFNILSAKQNGEAWTPLVLAYSVYLNGSESGYAVMFGSIVLSDDTVEALRHDREPATIKSTLSDANKAAFGMYYNAVDAIAINESKSAKAVDLINRLGGYEAAKQIKIPFDATHYCISRKSMIKVFSNASIDAATLAHTSACGFKETKLENDDLVTQEQIDSAIIAYKHKYNTRDSIDKDDIAVKYVDGSAVEAQMQQLKPVGFVEKQSDDIVGRWYDAATHYPDAENKFIEIEDKHALRYIRRILTGCTILGHNIGAPTTGYTLMPPVAFRRMNAVRWRYVLREESLFILDGDWQWYGDAKREAAEWTTKEFIVAGDEQYAVKPLEPAEPLPEKMHKELPPDATIAVPYDLAMCAIKELEAGGCHKLGKALMALVGIAEEEAAAKSSSSGEGGHWQSLSVDFPLNDRVVTFKKSVDASTSWTALVQDGAGINGTFGEEIGLTDLLKANPDTIWRYYNGDAKNVTKAKKQQDGD